MKPVVAGPNVGKADDKGSTAAALSNVSDRA